MFIYTILEQYFRKEIISTPGHPSKIVSLPLSKPQFDKWLVCRQFIIFSSKVKKKYFVANTF